MGTTKSSAMSSYPPTSGLFSSDYNNPTSMLLHMDADGRICGNHGGSGGFDAALSSDSVTDPPAPLVIACRAGANGLSQGVRHGHALSLRMPLRGSSGDHLVERLVNARAVPSGTARVREVLGVDRAILITLRTVVVIRQAVLGHSSRSSLCGALGCLPLGRCLGRGLGLAVGLGLAHSGRATPGPRSTACCRLAMGLESHDCDCGLPLPGQRRLVTTGFGSTSAASGLREPLPLWRLQGRSTSRQTRHRAERAITRGVANTTRSSSGSSSSG